MHAKQLAALAGWVASQANSIVQSNSINLTTQTEYWLNSRCRFQRWHSALKVFHSDLSEPQPLHDPWPAIKVVVQEVVCAELLTRIWATVLCLQDQVSGDNKFTGIANGTFVGHVEVRNRAMQLLLRSPSEQQNVVAELHSLCNRMERWTDLWLSMIEPVDLAAKFAFDSSRVNDFKLDQANSRLSDAANGVSKDDEAGLMLASFTSSLNLESLQHPANPDLNQSIGADIIHSVPDDRYSSKTLPHDTWRLKLEQSYQDAEALVSELLGQLVNGK